MLQTDNYLRFERVTAVEVTRHGLMAVVGGERLRIDLIRPDVVRFKISRGRVFDESPTFAVCVEPLGSSLDEPVEFSVQPRDEEVRLVTAEMTVTLGLDPFRLDVHRSDGTAVVESAADADGRYWTYATLNDAWTVRRRCRREDAIFGLGEKSGRHNRKGRDFTLWNTDVLNPYETLEFTAGKAPDDPRGDRTSVEFDPYYVSIPFFYHQTYPTGTMAASFVDNGYRGAYEFSQPEEYRISFRGGQYTEYVFAGPDMPEILEAYTWLTGRAAPPPLWSLGYHQCRWFHYTQDAVEALGRQHRDNDIPCDALWLDIEYMDGYRVFTWNAELFPDPRGMLERLAEQGFRVITIIDPGVKYEPGYPVFDAGLERDVFCRTEGGDSYIGQVWPGNTAFPDFVTEEARTWWGELNAAHVGSGLAGIWNDMNEPATGSIEPGQMHFGHGQYSHERYRNQYALLMAMGTRSGLLAAMPERRTFILSRSGFAGIQRYAANWLGDNQSRWDHLWLSVAMGAGLGISGQPFLGADIGGFQGNSNAELFLRWMQYGTLTPYRHRDRCAGAAAAGLRLPVRRLRPRHRRRVPARAGSTGGTGDRSRGHRAPGLPAGRRLVRLALRRAGRRIPVRGGEDAHGSHPDLRPRWRGDSDVDRGTRDDGRLPPEGGRAARLRPGRRRQPHLDARGGRRADQRCARRRLLPDNLHP
jgi:alpha-glucosidase